ncbi:hypothetical protein Q73A0000_03350 [Kaistella flava (ex Peng et al. 2021)]|uniref:Outer membrane protein beta-barrel domain-containing protein n=1 Tax=Kaistella flava (ex Peng et al. 2021) TaxID=2038776 RepID=A0A7M2Y5E8_9FLAO|nr:hypothetical protein [Kaistella flava (ex Peng et al. 2021)]QOW09467.1 hypothetical protein Q73A0000_03350 [Kaistella flava (ex Peng et al. 2021)]
MKQISFLSLFLTVFISAQKFKPAVVTFNNDDEKIGNVAYNNPIMTPQTFEFKEGSEQAKKLGKREIKEVNITDKAKFIKAEIEISRHPENLQNLENNKNFHIKKEEHFIEQIAFGKYNLYKYSDDMNKAYFYSSEDSDGIKPLLFKEYFLNENAKASNKEYLTVLEKINCGNNNYKNVLYLESSLTNYFNEINQCNGETNTEYKKPNDYIEHKIYGAYSQVKDPNETGFGGGYEFEYHLPLNNYSFAVAAAPGFFVYNEKKDLAYREYSTKSIISFPILLRYYPIKTKDFKMYASYSIVNFSQMNQTYMSYNNQEEKIGGFTAFENNFFELGLRIKTLEAFARFHSRSGGEAISLGLKYNIYSTKK